MSSARPQHPWGRYLVARSVGTSAACQSLATNMMSSPYGRPSLPVGTTSGASSAAMESSEWNWLSPNVPSRRRYRPARRYAPGWSTKIQSTLPRWQWKKRTVWCAAQPDRHLHPGVDGVLAAAVAAAPPPSRGRAPCCTGGRLPQTSPSPPVFDHGATSLVTNTRFCSRSAGHRPFSWVLDTRSRPSPTCRGGRDLVAATLCLRGEARPARRNEAGGRQRRVGEDWGWGLSGLGMGSGRGGVAGWEGGRPVSPPDAEPNTRRLHRQAPPPLCARGAIRAGGARAARPARARGAQGRSGARRLRTCARREQAARPGRGRAATRRGGRARGRGRAPRPPRRRRRPPPAPARARPARAPFPAGRGPPPPPPRQRPRAARGAEEGRPGRPPRAPRRAVARPARARARARCESPSNFGSTPNRLPPPMHSQRPQIPADCGPPPRARAPARARARTARARACAAANCNCGAWARRVNPNPRRSRRRGSAPARSSRYLIRPRASVRPARARGAAPQVETQPPAAATPSTRPRAALRLAETLFLPAPRPTARGKIARDGGGATARDAAAGCAAAAGRRRHRAPAGPCASSGRRSGGSAPSRARARAPPPGRAHAAQRG